jgi:hypothetical protein
MSVYRISDNGNDRDMTETEIAEFEQTKLTLANEKKANDKIEANRAKLKAETLAKLGLTADEVAALLS